MEHIPEQKTNMLSRLEQAKAETERKTAEKEKNRRAQLGDLAKEGADMATGNYRLGVKTDADMEKRRDWNEPKESKGHAEAEFREKTRLYEGLQELANEIEQQEHYASQLEKKITELELSEKGHLDFELSRQTLT